jgi:hypothetical protein
MPTKALQVRIESTGQVRGTRVYDAADGHEITNVVAVRFEHRVDQVPIVVLELVGGQLFITERALAPRPSPRAQRQGRLKNRQVPEMTSANSASAIAS